LHQQRPYNRLDWDGYYLRLCEYQQQQKNDGDWSGLTMDYTITTTTTSTSRKGGSRTGSGGAIIVALGAWAWNQRRLHQQQEQEQQEQKILQQQQQQQKPMGDPPQTTTTTTTTTTANSGHRPKTPSASQLKFREIRTLRLQKLQDIGIVEWWQQLQQEQFQTAQQTKKKRQRPKVKSNNSKSNIHNGHHDKNGNDKDESDNHESNTPIQEQDSWPARQERDEDGDKDDVDQKDDDRNDNNKVKDPKDRRRHDKLVQRELQWESHFQLLLEFNEQFQHLRVPVKYTTVCGKNLGRWANDQRASYLRKMRRTTSTSITANTASRGKKKNSNNNQYSISQDRIDRLTAIDFVWVLTKSPKKMDWHGHYQLLVAHRAKYHHLRGMTQSYTTPCGIHLGRWKYDQDKRLNPASQQLAVASNKFSPEKMKERQERIALLNAIDFPWDDNDLKLLNAVRKERQQQKQQGRKRKHQAQQSSGLSTFTNPSITGTGGRLSCSTRSNSSGPTSARNDKDDNRNSNGDGTESLHVNECKSDEGEYSVFSSETEEDKEEDIGNSNGDDQQEGSTLVV
jgi:hypothetical protein